MPFEQDPPERLLGVSVVADDVEYIRSDMVLQFAEYFATRYEFYDNTDIGNLYRRILADQSEPKYLMSTIFEVWLLEKEK